MRRFFTLLGVGAVLALPAGADAAKRHASPSGSGGACTAAAPCNLTAAVGGASQGDEVIVRPGDYQLNAGLDDPARITIHGVAGKPRPRLFPTFSSQAVRLDDGSTLRYVEIDDINGTALFLGSASRADQLIVRGTGTNGTLANIQSSVLTNSLVVSSGDNAETLTTDTNAGDNESTYRNVTAIALGAGASALYVEAFGNAQDSGHAKINAINVIAQAPDGAAMRAETAGAGATTSAGIVAVNSNYSTRDTTGTNATVTTPGSGSNQTAPPQFEPGFGYHQVAGSPTIDAGLGAQQNGTLDVDGDLRSIGGKTDIGADELLVPPVVVTGSVSNRKPRSVTVSGTVASRGAATTYRFEFGTSAAYGQSTPTRTLAPKASPQKVSATLTGLNPGTRYHVRLVASNAAGPASGADRAFATRFPGVRILSKNATVEDGVATIRLRCPVGTAGTCDGKLRLRTLKKPLLTVGSAPFSIAPGQTAQVQVEISEKGRELVNEKGELRVRARAKAHNGNGVARTTTRKVTLRPPQS